jgi:hypothetical protein
LEYLSKNGKTSKNGTKFGNEVCFEAYMLSFREGHTISPKDLKSPNTLKEAWIELDSLGSCNIDLPARIMYSILGKYGDLSFSDESNDEGLQ